MCSGVTLLPMRTKVNFERPTKLSTEFALQRFNRLLDTNN